MSNSSVPLLERRNWASAKVVDLSSTNNQFAIPFAGLWIGVSGDVTVDMADSGIQVTFKGVPIGEFRIFGTQIYKVGTSATNILALN